MIIVGVEAFDGHIAQGREKGRSSSHEHTRAQTRGLILGLALQPISTSTSIGLWLSATWYT